jgi:predicted nucleic acid-binding protein
MIAVDTSSLVAYLRGDHGQDVEEVGRAFELRHAVLPPVVVTEILSDPNLSAQVIGILLQIPLLPIHEGYWVRAGKSLSKVLSKGYKARIADALISQICIDNDISLLTRDKDFRHFKSLCGLDLVL